jgi:alpha/beta superfamily hydrolase
VAEGAIDRVTFQTEDGIALEGEIRLSDGAQRASAVICHPHPEQGGSKDHPLLWAIRNDLAHRGFLVLSFNFRGVMGSAGSFGGGVDEIADVRAAIGHAREEAPQEAPTLVVGWSFGAHVALREAMDDPRVAALALIGLPLDEGGVSLPALPALPDRHRLKAFDKPVLLLAGEADLFCPVPLLRALGRSLPRATVEILKGTDHFFWKREREVAGIVGEFAERVLFGQTATD